MKRVLVAGQATHERGRAPWAGERSRLHRWLGGGGWDELVGRGVVFTNVGVVRGKRGKGDGFMLSTDLLAQVRRNARHFDLVVLVGRKAQDAVAPGLGRGRLVWKEGRYCGVPHPSGVNRQLNGGAGDRVGRWLRRKVREAPEW